MRTDARYHPGLDQKELAATIGDSLEAILPISRLHKAQQENAEAWRALESLGVFAIGVSEALGGSGLGVVEEALIALELGRRIATPSVFATMGAAVIDGGSARLPAPAERRIASGYLQGERVIFVDDPDANLLLVRDFESASVCEYPASSAIIDESLWSCSLRAASQIGEPLAAFASHEILRLRLIDAAALAGLAQAALDMGVDYAKLREQFGRPIGSFQAIKHHCANMALTARSARDQVGFAAVAVAEGRDDSALQVESAFFVAGSAAMENTGKNIQIHGGIGFSSEASPHHLLKRARLLLSIGGDLEPAISRIADIRLKV